MRHLLSHSPTDRTVLRLLRPGGLRTVPRYLISDHDPLYGFINGKPHSSCGVSLCARLFHSCPCGLFFGAGRAERIGEGVVSFMAGVLVYRTWCLLHRNLAGPWPHEGLRIVDGELVKKRVLIEAGETFGQAHILSRSSEVRFVREVRRFDDESFALPPAPGVAKPLMNTRRQMRAGI